MKVKICGITGYEDAALAVDAGADALGFNFFPPSPRYIDPKAASAIIRRLPPFVVTVGLFVNVERPEDLERTALIAGVEVIQLHGDESPDYCRMLSNRPLIKALRIGDKPVAPDLDSYPVRAFLLDVKDDVLFGGTGKSFDWNLARGIDRKRPVILAGGLRPDNVQAAIRTVRPYGVDVCSGVEREPGKKDPVKLVEFMDEVRNVGR
ncbi:MAG: phosphoribosylanthranilate isomerase [Acidobacteria bacterium]|nr:phosphoribosylanthranilate isomerase [Acidobacteriota bacterium]